MVQRIPRTVSSGERISRKEYHELEIPRKNIAAIPSVVTWKTVFVPRSYQGAGVRAQTNMQGVTKICTKTVETWKTVFVPRSYEDADGRAQTKMHEVVKVRTKTVFYADLR